MIGSFLGTTGDKRCAPKCLPVSGSAVLALLRVSGSTVLALLVGSKMAERAQLRYFRAESLKAPVYFNQPEQEWGGGECACVHACECVCVPSPDPREECTFLRQAGVMGYGTSFLI